MSSCFLGGKLRSRWGERFRRFGLDASGTALFFCFNVKRFLHYGLQAVPIFSNKFVGKVVRNDEIFIIGRLATAPTGR